MLPSRAVLIGATLVMAIGPVDEEDCEKEDIEIGREMGKEGGDGPKKGC